MTRARLQDALSCGDDRQLVSFVKGHETVLRWGGGDVSSPLKRTAEGEFRPWFQLSTGTTFPRVAQRFLNDGPGGRAIDGELVVRHNMGSSEEYFKRRRLPA
jgi:hypothetical protein